jgi:hypothetical protein
MSRGAQSALAALVVVCALLPSASYAQESAVLKADFRIVLTSDTTCDVTADLVLDRRDAGDVVHRLQLFDGAQAELAGVTGASIKANPAIDGRTLVLTVTPASSAAGAYSIRYRVIQPVTWGYRCPLWLPTLPMTGQMGAVRLQVTLPPGSTATRGTFPAFTWTQEQGAASIGHIPAFVQVPFRDAGHDPGWWARQDIATMTDMTAVVVLVLGTLFWVWRARAARAARP